MSSEFDGERGRGDGGGRDADSPDSGSPVGPCPYPEYDPADDDAGDLPATGADASGVEAAVWDALADVEDPEMPVSVVDLGLIYGVDVTDGRATVDMTLTYTGCPARGLLTDDVESAAAGPEGVAEAAVRLVWNPPWSVEMVTESGRASLREFGLSI